MDAQSAFQLPFHFHRSKPVVVEPTAGQVTSDAGLLPFRMFDEQIGLTRQLAEALEDRRHGSYIDHSFLEMTRMRVYGILADYADQNDHDVLRSDPVFKLICDRSIEDDDLASQPTLSRFENAIDVPTFFRLRDLQVDQFIGSFDKPPTQLTLDIDTFDDATDGDQQLTFFHGYYDQYQYQPRVAGRSLRTDRGRSCFPAPRMMRMPIEARARTATRNSSAVCWPIASATTATLPICFACICTQPVITCWLECAATLPSYPRNRAGTKFQLKPFPVVAVGSGTAAAGNTIPWARAIHARGAHG